MILEVIWSDVGKTSTSKKGRGNLSKLLALQSDEVPKTVVAKGLRTSKMQNKFAKSLFKISESFSTLASAKLKRRSP